MKSFKLIKLNEQHKEKYLEYVKDWKDEKMSPFTSRMFGLPFETYLELLEKQENIETVKIGYMPSSTFVFVDEEEEIYGVVNIRHQLNELLTNIGGHIGYGIKPSKRRLGYAKIMLNLALLEAKNRGIDKALLICNKDNLPSKKTIERCGGLFENEFIEENKNVVLRYWIEVK
ncbi:MAG: GNAT family N-acetyltransferase [Firmicutes bacterium]|nr:GNAT family N-acetyltransferase [Bacillota bacterium]